MCEAYRHSCRLHAAQVLRCYYRTAMLLGSTTALLTQCFTMAKQPTKQYFKLQQQISGQPCELHHRCCMGEGEHHLAPSTEKAASVIVALCPSKWVQHPLSVLYSKASFGLAAHPTSTSGLLLRHTARQQLALLTSSS